MKVTLKAIILGILVGCVSILFYSCNKTNEGGKWDDNSFTFSLPSAGITYTLPTDPQLWAIAPIERLSNEIKFCGVDSESEVCVMIISLDKSHYNASSLQSMKPHQIRRFVEDVSRQSEIKSVICDSSSIAVTKFKDIPAYEFRTDLVLCDSLKDIDNLHISYCGYIFDSPKGLYSIVATIPTDLTKNAQLYLNGLKFSKNHE